MMYLKVSKGKWIYRGADWENLKTVSKAMHSDTENIKSRQSKILNGVKPFYIIALTIQWSKQPGFCEAVWTYKYNVVLIKRMVF